jgi:endonuclease/exonuclease/phosphatase family metal-dependent hydrolase
VKDAIIGGKIHLSDVLDFSAEFGILRVPKFCSLHASANSVLKDCIMCGKSAFSVLFVLALVLVTTDLASAAEPTRTAYNPSPADDVNAVAHSDMSLTLSWSPGFGADSHDVYFGTDYNNVNDANTTLTLGVYKGNQSANSYNSVGLQSGIRYCWRIDEVDGPNTRKGRVWSFTTKRGVNLGVMSFNIYGGGTSSTDPNAWIYTEGLDRRERVVAMILSESVAFGTSRPDIIGLQEDCGYEEVNYLKRQLVGYGFYGVGRNDGVSNGDYNGIFYRSNRFNRLSQGSFWLSLTPDVPGSKHPVAGHIRIASWVILYDNMTGRNYFVLNTHLDNQSQPSRLWSAQLIRQRIKKYSGGLPVILTGDLNCHEDSEEFLELIGKNDPSGFQLRDSYREVHPVRQSDEASYHGFTGGTSGSRIDFVLHTSFFEATGATIETAKVYDRYPSDHYAVTGTLYIAAIGAGQ